MSTTTMRRRARDVQPLGHMEGVTVLHCDAAGCGRQFNAGLVENRGGTRLAASRYGWTSEYVSAANHFRDNCPAHQTNGTEEENR